MDQALEQVYNKPAKGAGGVIDIMRRKEAVAVWNIVKHEKEGYTSNLRSEGQVNGLNGENTLHHDFSKTTAISSSKDVEMIVEYIKKVCNPLSSDLNGENVRNIVNGEENKEEFEFCMTSLDQGHDLYNEYASERLIEKSVRLLDKITRNKQGQKSTERRNSIDVNRETNRMMKYMLP